MLKLYKNTEPTVSIILPTYNRADLLPRAIDSVFNQNFSNYELIIVDDGSTDATFDVVNQFINKGNVRYIKHSNRHLPVSLNTGIAASCGKYITFLGSDDEYKKDHIRLRVEIMQSNPEVALIHGGVEVIGDPYVKDKNDTSKLIHVSECAVGGTFFGKRGVFIELNGFKDIEYSEDSEFLERVSSKFHVKKIAFPTYIYHRETPDSITNSIY